MYSPIKRWLAVGTATAIALVGLTASTPTASAASTADGTKAANYLVRNLPSAKSATSDAIATALGFATTGDCTYAPSARKLVDGLEDIAKKYTSGQPGKAARLAISVSALGLNPKSFGGVNLVSAITKSLPADGRIGSSDSAFTQSLAIIALKRAGATIPVTLLTKLLSLQDSSGAFGYEYPAGTFNADPDTTALAILALDTLGNLDPQLDKAVDAAQDSMEADGYWSNYSPVDSTSLMATALRATGADVTSSAAWLATQQLSNGGFPAELDGTSSNTLATAEALFLATGKTMVNASLNLGKCPKNPKKLPASVTSCTGVWVVVDRGNGQETARCATKYSTGLEALKSAGFAVELKSGFVNRIHGFPMVIDTTFSKYWGYWHASPNPDGSWGDWESYLVGATASTPKKGDVEGWYYGPYTETASFLQPPAGYSSAPTPTIDNTTPKVGDTLTVSAGSWTPTPDKVAIRWYRSGKAISKATSTTYKVTKSDNKKVITVKVTASGDGLQTVSKTSAATAKVTK
ncbi:hypothetical protein [Propionicimonas sp.]|uniref:hypothetical protein n=1 Tax=Propionicimonas sp. TaxID=1955623 RepID=UPI0039E6F7C8